MALLPDYFYNINARLPDGRTRWFDEFADPAPSIIQPGKDLNPQFLKARAQRNEVYSRWLAAFFTEHEGNFVPLIKPKQMVWQAIRIHKADHSENNANDWWDPFQDAVFRAFVSPETVYCYTSGEHKQWYLLSPEDCYLVNCWYALKAGRHIPHREIWGREKYLSGEPDLRKARLVPVECCMHMRHETSGGILPEGL